MNHSYHLYRDLRTLRTPLYYPRQRVSKGNAPQLIRLILVLLTIVLASSCGTPEEKKMVEAGWCLNKIEMSLNAWGKITVSDLELVPNKGQFKVPFEEDATNYVQAARNNVSSDARALSESSLYLAFAAQGQVTPPVAPGLASTSTNSPGQLEVPTQAQAAMTGFTPGLTLSGLNPTIDERQAVLKGINDKIAEQILKLMANPDSGTNQQAVLFGAMQVTCQPGQLTRKHYIAELDVSLKYCREDVSLPLYTTNAAYADSTTTLGIDAESRNIVRIKKEVGVRNLTDKVVSESGQTLYAVGKSNTVYHVSQHDQPRVLAVLPLMDSRNTALSTSSRSQVELASALSLAFAAKGLNAAAKSLADYVAKHEFDIDTRNSLPVATTYADGRHFGFQVYPSLQAMEDPSKAGSPGNVLQPITFPLVVVVLVDKDDLVGTNSIADGGPWSLLVTEVQTRWIPIKKPSTFFVPSADVASFLGKHYPLFERFVRAAALDSASKLLDQVSAHGEEYPTNVPPDIRNQYLQMQIALDLLKTSAMSHRTAIRLPITDLFPVEKTDTNKPSITDVFPHVVWRDTNTTFTILVRGLTNPQDVTGVTIAGVSCQPSNIYVFPTTVITNTVVNSKTNTVILYFTNNIAFNATLPPRFLGTTNSTNTVEFVVLAKNAAPINKAIAMPLQGRLSAEAAVAVNRDTSGKVTGLTVKHGENLSEQQLLDAIKTVLERSEPPPKTTTIVR